MKILIADDDPVARRILEAAVASWGYEPLLARDGREAWELIEDFDGPSVMILDWMMPHADGPEICQRLRPIARLEGSYVILLTSRERAEDLVEGLESGADDYVTKPFTASELRARVSVGVRVVELQRKLTQRVLELKAANSEVNQLQGLLPICAYCKRIRDDENFWQAVEAYVGARSGARFSHGICPDCHDVHVQPELDRL